MAGGSDNTITIKHVIISEGGSESGFGAGISGLTGEKLEQAALSLSTIAQKLDAALSNKSQYFKNKDPEAEKTRKLELLNAETNSRILKEEKKTAEERKRLQENERTQRNIIQAAGEKQQQYHSNRLEFENLKQFNREKNRLAEEHQRTKNRYLALAGIIGAAVASVGKSFGSGYGNYSLSNSLIRPDLAYSQLVSNNINTGSNTLTGLLMAGGAALGSEIPGIGTIVGGIAGGALGGLVNFFTPQIAAGQTLQNAGQYFSQLPQYSYGSMYAGANANTLKTAAIMPGGNQNTQQALYSYYGAVRNGGALGAALQGTSLFTELTGSQLAYGQIVSSLPGIFKSSGVGGSQSKVATLLETLTNYQRQYGGDTVQNLQNISALLQNSVVAGNTALTMAYAGQAMNPALSKAQENYAGSDYVSQFVQNTLTKGLLGVSMNDLMGINGPGTMVKAIKHVQGMGRYKAGTLNSTTIRESLGLGSSLYPILDAQTGNLNGAPSYLSSQAKAAYSKIGAGGTLGISDVQGVYDPYTVNQIKQAASAESDYNISAKVVMLTGDVIKGFSEGGIVGAGYESASALHSMIHKDNS